jgi:RNA polymerase sigma-70 factor, ECF subfamily
MAIASHKPPGELAELVRTHQAGVWRYLRFLGADESQADDLAQETFLAAWAKPFVEHSPAATRAYLRTIARNLYLMALRKQRRQPTLERLEAADDVWRRLTRDDDDWLDDLRDCLEALTDRARQAIDLCYRDGCSRSEIGRALGLSEDGVKSLLRRSRETLRSCIERKKEQKRSLEP